MGMTTHTKRRTKMNDFEIRDMYDKVKAMQAEINELKTQVCLFPCGCRLTGKKEKK